MTADSQGLDVVHAAVAKVRWRLRRVAAVRALGPGLVAAATVALVDVCLWRLGLLGGALRGVAIAAVPAALAIAAIVGACRRQPVRRVARLVDGRLGLADRLGSALELARSSPRPSALELLAIRDAAAMARTVDARRVAPFLAPAHAWLALPIGLLALGAAWVRLPTKRAAIVSSPHAPHLVIDHDLLDGDRAAAAELAHTATANHDAEAASLAQDLGALIERLDRGELTRKQVFDALDELEQRALVGERGDFEELAEQLRKAGNVLGKDPLARDAGRALEKMQLGDAAEKTQRLADRVAQGQLSSASQRELARSLDQASRHLERNMSDKNDAARAAAQDAQAERDRQERERLHDEQRRLQRDRAEHPNDPETARRLQRNERQLERLERRAQQQYEQRRQLQRLQRNLESAASGARHAETSAGQRQASESLRDAANALQKMQDEQRKLEARQQSQQAIASLKELLRRQASASGGGGGQQAQAAPGGGGGGQGQGQTQAAGGGSQGRSQGSGGGAGQAMAAREVDVMKPSDGNGSSPSSGSDGKQGEGARDRVWLPSDGKPQSGGSAGAQGAQAGAAQAAGAGAQPQPQPGTAPSTASAGSPAAGQDALAQDAKGEHQQQQAQNGKKEHNGKSGQGANPSAMMARPSGGSDGKSPDSQIHDFMMRAAGDKPGPRDGQLILPGHEGASQPLAMPLPPSGNGSDPGGGSGQSGAPTGDGIGNTHDPHLLGEATRLRARHTSEQLVGQQGAGPSRSETILGAASRGFATTAYKRVYGDYTSISEDAMSREQVPPGYRYYVKRYFQLIKPRD